MDFHERLWHVLGKRPKTPSEAGTEYDRFIGGEWIDAHRDPSVGPTMLVQFWPGSGSRAMRMYSSPRKKSGIFPATLVPNTRS